jgi:glycosyltransferase involved in cell wall biosynthesis
VKIALVSEHASPLAVLGGVDSGGQNVYVAALARQLARRGHEVVVFTRRCSRVSPSAVPVDGYVVEHLPAGPLAAVSKDDLLSHVPELTDHLHDRLRTGGFDLVHAHFWMSGLASCAAAKPLGIPVVQTFHGLGSVKRRHQGHRDTSPPTRPALERRLCREVDHVIATCGDEVSELYALGLPAGHVSIIPCGVDTDLFRPTGADYETPRFAAVGRLVERKGVADVIAALAEVPEATLAIAGGSSGRSILEDNEARRLGRLAERYGVRRRVRFVGSVPRAEAARIMSRSLAVVSAPWYEPFGIVPVEAMACGRPVIGTAVGGLLDTVDEGVTGTLVPPRRPDLIAAAMRELMADPARAASYGRAGRRKAVREYRWDRVAEAVEVVYLQVRSGVPAVPARSVTVAGVPTEVAS